ncbi:hypothetical protein [Loktanella sp. Alg231-35]|uniref:hypothetical protein n=1 Tax=Loktanella sp. Alg231-35 TaxID=1922220 RepID=UPI000D54F5AF|nr:hypothetical protein [Loktanella sp. Alg231-35]
MTDPALSVAFHIGVHKTATSHLQDALGTAQEAMRADGVSYLGPDAFRLPGRTIPVLFGLRTKAAVPHPPAVDRLIRMAAGGHRVVISEENFIGPLNPAKDARAKPRYPAAARRLNGLAEAMGQQVAVFVALRRPTTFINSAYCQSLLGGSIDPVASYLARNGPDEINWHAMIRDMVDAPNIGHITVWRYEDYASLFEPITQALVGTQAASHLMPSERRINRGLSSAAVAEVLHRRGDSTIDLPATVARQMLSVDHGYPAFDAFTPAEHAASEVAYTAQIEGIAALPDVTVLRP